MWARVQELGSAQVRRRTWTASLQHWLFVPEWKEAFPPGDGSGPMSPLAKLIGLVEKAGKFVVDYPSYILLVCLINHVEIYLLVYAVVVCLYATRALTGISLKLWRVNPYAPKE